ncbi:adenylyl-sulfate kinase [Algiphilus sp.]|uniref:adenylyl-sulfate kinase n=1 Tax=Algiphilus sp. TaxID=1872431 RepID=UPI002A658E2D|nr:adenylyl-sulfate kinase [Pseudomonadota bacterium]
MEQSSNVVWHMHQVTHEDRVRQMGQKPCILWFTGLSGSGKSTLANALEGELFRFGHHSYLLDGDNVRHGLNKDLGFSDADRVENIRRIGEVAKLFVDAGMIVLTAFISPFRSDRDLVRHLVGDGQFIEVHVKAPLEVCESRDPKGLYRKARAGEIKHFTGIDSPYEAPERPEIVIDTGADDLETCTGQLLDFLVARGAVSRQG